MFVSASCFALSREGEEGRREDNKSTMNVKCNKSKDKYVR